MTTFWTQIPLLLGVTLAAFGFIPALVTSLIVRLYPTDHPRRSELMAELRVISRFQRPFYAAELLEVTLAEAIPMRLRSAWSALTGQSRQHRATVEMIRVDLAELDGVELVRHVTLWRRRAGDRSGSATLAVARGYDHALIRAAAASLAEQNYKIGDLEVLTVPRDGSVPRDICRLGREGRDPGSVGPSFD